MDTGRLWGPSWFHRIGSLLNQIRTLFLGLLLVWPLFGLLSVISAGDGRETALAVGAILALEIWLVLGFRWRRFPGWSWIPEGALIYAVAAASDYGPTIGLLFLWVNFRALYGSLREKILAAVVILSIMTAGVVFFDVSPTTIIPLMFTGILCLTVNHILARVIIARVRSADRESTLASAGAGLVASTNRAEAMDVTLGAALGVDRAASAALIFTVAGRTLNVVAVAGQVGDEAAGWVTELGRLPDEAKAAMRPGKYAILIGERAAAVTEVLRLPPHEMVVLAPMAAHGDVFGMLVLALDGRPADDLSAAVTTLADEAALTLDQLLSRSRLSIVVEHSADTLMLAGERGSIRFVNPAAEAGLGSSSSDLLGRDVWSLLHPDDVEAIREPAPPHVAPVAKPCRIRGHEDRGWTEVEALIEYVTEHDGSRSIVFTARDVSERQRLELDLRHAQKLESVGRLAAGIAHEINTPIQFIGDNVRFLDSAFADMGPLYAAYRQLLTAVHDPESLAEALRNVEADATDIDIDFIMEEVPVAIAQTLDGITRVAGIVRAMKAFGHPGTEQKTKADLNEAIGNTLVVANNEIKYVADVETDLAELPLVYCHLGDINQVMLNLVVNAAQAIGSADRGRGTIRVSTRLEGSYVLIEVADTGTGVPPEIADRLFDPFFTTKEVGTGTGQGLALVRTLVAGRHGGTVTFTTEAGTGTVFTVRLPVDLDETAGDDRMLSEAVS
jgi:PAS domain S-box-containing protein